MNTDPKYIEFSETVARIKNAAQTCREELLKDGGEATATFLQSLTVVYRERYSMPLNVNIVDFPDLEEANRTVCTAKLLGYHMILLADYLDILDSICQNEETFPEELIKASVVTMSGISSLSLAGLNEALELAQSYRSEANKEQTDG